MVSLRFGSGGVRNNPGCDWAAALSGIAGLAALLVAVGCGGDTNETSSAALDGGGGFGGVSVGGAAGSGGSVTAGAPGTGGAVTASCSGAWGTSSQVVYAAPAGARLASPTVSPDELEIFYSISTDSTNWSFRRSSRSSTGVAFGDGVPVPELDAACPDSALSRNMDLSQDGLTAYFVCYMEGQTPIQGALRVARRQALGAPFVLDATSYGTVGPSVSIGPGELVLYSTALTNSAPPLVYTRASTSAPFGSGTPVPGLESVNLVTPDPSPDGLSLVGALNSSVVTVTRSAPNGPFGPSAPLLSPSANTDVFGSPDIAPSCRSLYFIYLDEVTNPSANSIRVASRP